MAASVESSVRVPKYVQLADDLRQRIAEGEFPPDAPLPSFSEMRSRFDATQRTVEKAHAILEEDQVVRRATRGGMVVNNPNVRATTDFVAFVDERVARHLPYHREVQNGIRIQAEEYGKSITLVDNPNTFKHWKSMDGLLLDQFGPYRESDFVYNCPKNIPVVRLHTLEEGISSVMADDAEGIRMAVHHLHDLGHRRIGFLLRDKPVDHNPGTPWTSKIRYDAYLEAMRAKDITVEPEWGYSYYAKNFDFRETEYYAMQRWLREGWHDLKLTAILAQNDYAAMGMIQALEEQGIRVPEDVSIVGFDGIDFRVSPTMELTTIVVPLREIGTIAMRELVGQINHPSRPPQTIKLPVRLHKGGTTAPPGKA